MIDLDEYTRLGAELAELDSEKFADVVRRLREVVDAQRIITAHMRGYLVKKPEAAVQ